MLPKFSLPTHGRARSSVKPCSRSSTIAATEFAPGVGESCSGLRRTSRPPIGGGIRRAIEEAAAFGIAVSLDGKMHARAPRCRNIGGRASPHTHRAARRRRIPDRRANRRGAAPPMRCEIPAIASQASARMRSSVLSANSRHSAPVKDARGFEIRGDKHRVPADVERLIHKGSGPRSRRAASSFPFARASRSRALASSIPSFFASHFDARRRSTEHFSPDCGASRRAGRRRSKLPATRASSGVRTARDFLQRPGEIIAVVVERLVGVLARVKSAARGIGKHFADPVR